MIFDWASYKKMKYDDGTELEDGFEAIGWLCTLAVVVAIFIPPIYHLIMEKGSFWDVSTRNFIRKLSRQLQKSVVLWRVYMYFDCFTCLPSKS